MNMWSLMYAAEVEKEVKGFERYLGVKYYKGTGWMCSVREKM